MNAPSPSLRRRRVVVAILIGAAIGIGLVAAFRHGVAPSGADKDDEAESVVKAPSRVLVRDGIVTLILDQAAQRKGGIETAAPTTPPAQESVSGYGAVLDASRITELDSRYLDAKAQAQIAQSKLAVSRAAYERAKALYKDRQNVSAAQLESAEGNFEVDEASLAAARSRLAAVTASALQSWGPVLAKALIDGAPLIEELIGRRAYLVKVTLPPGVTMASPPQAASAELGGGRTIKLAFVSLATTTDPQIQGTAYFYQTPASDAALPGLNVMASLPEAGAATGVVAPEAAVVWLQGKAWIYLQVKPDTFVRREIASLRPAPEGGYLVSDLPKGARIAVVGAQMLLSEEFRAQTTAGDED